MRLTQKTFWLVLGTVMVVQAGSAQAMHHIREAIEARNVEWAATYNAGDAAGVAAIYEENATLMPPGTANVVGRAGIEEAIGGFFAVLKDMTLVTDEVIEAGDHAIEIGRAVYTAIGADGSETPTSDKYVVVWHKGEDGVWRYLVDIFAPGPAAAE